MTVDWREIFKRYTNIVGRAEAVDFLYVADWTPEEWVEIQKASDEAIAELKKEGGYAGYFK